MSARPVIGITLEVKQTPDDARSMGEMKLNWNYTQAIANAGGVPIIVPPHADMATIANMIDGWLIPGGLDIDAARFGQPNHPSVKLQDPARYDSESRLYNAIDPDLPVLGICYGCQFLNVKRGGSLEQHIPDRVGHSQHEGGTLAAVELASGSKIASIMGMRVEGKSYHHQAIDGPGAGLDVVGRHEDGTIEAVEDASHPWLIGVQWHPERTLDDPATRRLFASFVEAASAFRARKSEQVTV